MMTDIEAEAKALALLNEVQAERLRISFTHIARDASACEALCRAIEQREAAEQELNDYREKVSSKVGRYVCNPTANSYDDLRSLIIPAPKPDPLVAMAESMGYYGNDAEDLAEEIRAELDALGFEIMEKNDD